MNNVQCKMRNGACLTHFTLYIIHYSLYPAVAVQLGLVDCKV